MSEITFIRKPWVLYSYHKPSGNEMFYERAFETKSEIETLLSGRVTGQHCHYVVNVLTGERFDWIVQVQKIFVRIEDK